MKYLINWIKKTIKPDNYVSSLTTTSQYFHKYGKKVRIADHLSDHNDNDLEIIVIKDLSGNNKQYLIKDATHPTCVFVKDVKTVKTVIQTFLFHYQCNYLEKHFSDGIKQLKATDVIKIADGLVSSDDARSKTFFNAVNLIKCKRECLCTEREKGIFFEYTKIALPQYADFTGPFKRVCKKLLYDRSYADFISILNIEFPAVSTSAWKVLPLEDRVNKIKKYIPSLLEVEQPNSVVEEPKTVSSEINSIILNDINSELTNDDKKKLNKKKKKQIQKLDEHKKALEKAYNKSLGKGKRKTIISAELGTLLGAETDVYHYMTPGQRHVFRDMVINDFVPYDVIKTLLVKTMKPSSNGKHANPEIGPLKTYVNAFLEQYRIGILKFPGNETSFGTTFVNEYTKTYDANVIDPLSEFPDRSLENTEVTEKSEPEIPIVSEPVNTEPTKFTINSDYEYSNDFKIENVNSLFNENQINIINTVIDTLVTSQKSTSFEVKRLKDVFKEHYTEHWDKLTNSQRDLFAEIITKEHMNLNETDFIINKIFKKDSIKWPDIDQCRTFVSEYSRRIRECRIAA